MADRGNRYNARDTRIFCYDCHEFTLSVEPIVIRRFENNRFHINVICEKCGLTKGKFYNDTYFNQFPSFLYDLTDKKFYINIVPMNGNYVNLKEYLFPIINNVGSKPGFLRFHYSANAAESF